MEDEIDYPIFISSVESASMNFSEIMPLNYSSFGSIFRGKLTADLFKLLG